MASKLATRHAIPHIKPPNDNFGFDDGAKIWDGQTGTKDGYYDAMTRKTKVGEVALYTDDGSAGEAVPAGY
jgi:hypothetical protein